MYHMLKICSIGNLLLRNNPNNNKRVKCWSLEARGGGIEKTLVKLYNTPEKRNYFKRSMVSYSGYSC